MGVFGYDPEAIDAQEPFHRQIIGVLKEAHAGMATADLVRKHGISQQTF